MGKYLPGKPSIVVQNMPGAGGLKAMDYIVNVAPKDGSYLGAMVSGVAYEPMLGSTGGTGSARFDPPSLNWVGSMAKQVAVTILRNPTPIKTFADLQHQSVIVGSSGPTATNSIYPRLMNSVFGTRFQIIEGYAGQAPVYLAMERGEVQGAAGLYYSSLVSGKGDWLRDRKISIIVQIALEKAQDLPHVPLLYDLAKSDEDRQVLRLALAGLLMGHPFVLPDRIPSDRVEVIRDAFMATVRDTALLAEAKKMSLPITPLSGQAVKKVVTEMYASPKPVVDRVRSIFNPSKN
jgi:tripartite-type tricarboxylate transporter receptor subunit TctC